MRGQRVSRQSGIALRVFVAFSLFALLASSGGALAERGRAFGHGIRPTKLSPAHEAQFKQSFAATERQVNVAFAAMAKRRGVIAVAAHLAKSVLRVIPIGRDKGRVQEHLSLGPPSTIDEDVAQVLLPGARYASLYRNEEPLIGLPGKFSLGAKWVAWVTKKADVEHNRKRPEKKHWRAPVGLPKTFRQIANDVWGKLFKATALNDDGITRGHMVDSGASGATDDDMLSTYVYFGNAFPQWRDSNAGAWHTLEQDIREVARQGYVVHQFAGPIWQPFRYTQLDGSAVQIEPEVVGNNIPVPTAFWKVAVAVPSKGADGKPLDLAHALADARVFSVVVPNARDVGLMASDWTRFATSAGAIEKQAGLRFFSHLPDGELRDSLLTHVDRRQGFVRKTQIPEWKSKVLNALASGTGHVADAARAMLARGEVVTQVEPGRGGYIPTKAE